MKGSLAISLRSMIQERYGVDTWREIMRHAGIPGQTIFMAVGDIDDASYFELVEATRRVMKWSKQEVWEHVADYWVCNYTQKVYGRHYEGIDDARSFLLHMDEVHRLVTKATKNAAPPRFEFHEEEDRSLVVRYRSPRGMFEYFIALVRSVARYYGEAAEIRQIGQDRIRVKFIPQAVPV